MMLDWLIIVALFHAIQCLLFAAESIKMSINYILKFAMFDILGIIRHVRLNRYIDRIICYIRTWNKTPHPPLLHIITLVKIKIWLCSLTDQLAFDELSN